MIATIIFEVEDRCSAAPRFEFVIRCVVMLVGGGVIKSNAVGKCRLPHHNSAECVYLVLRLFGRAIFGVGKVSQQEKGETGVGVQFAVVYQFEWGEGG